MIVERSTKIRRKGEDSPWTVDLLMKQIGEYYISISSPDKKVVILRPFYVIDYGDIIKILKSALTLEEQGEKP